MTQNEHENEQPSWIFTKARIRSSPARACTQPIAPTSPATAAGTSSLGRANHGHVGRDLLEGRWEVRGATRDVDASVRPRGAGDGLTRLRDGLVRDAARIHDRDVTRARHLAVAVAEQSLANRLRVRVRDLAAQEAHGEGRHRRD